MWRSATDESYAESSAHTPVGRANYVATRLAEEAAAVLAKTMKRELALVSAENAALLLAKRMLQKLALYYGFDRMIPALVGEGIYQPAEWNDLVNRVLNGQQFDKLAMRILKHPTGKGLRAPNSRTPRASHDDIMHTDLDEL